MKYVYAMLLCLLAVPAKAGMTWTVYVATNTEDVEHSQSAVVLGTTTEPGYLIEPQGAGFKCIVTDTIPKQLSPDMVLDARYLTCLLSQDHAVAVVTVCLEQDTTSNLSQLIVVEKGHEYLISLGCENTAPGKK